MPMASPSNKTAAPAGNILIVDDQIKLRNQLRRIISVEGYKVYEASDPEMVIKILAKEDIEVVISNYQLSVGENVAIISLPPSLNNIEDDPKAILTLISHALEKVRLQKRIHQLEQWAEQPPDFDNILGESSVIREAISLARKIAP